MRGVVAGELLEEVGGHSGVAPGVAVEADVGVSVVAQPGDDGAAGVDDEVERVPIFGAGLDVDGDGEDASGEVVEGGGFEGVADAVEGELAGGGAFGGEGHGQGSNAGVGDGEPAVVGGDDGRGKGDHGLEVKLNGGERDGHGFGALLDLGADFVDDVERRLGDAGGDAGEHGGIVAGRVLDQGDLETGGQGGLADFDEAGRAAHGVADVGELAVDADADAGYGIAHEGLVIGGGGDDAGELAGLEGLGVDGAGLRDVEGRGVEGAGGGRRGAVEGVTEVGVERAAVDGDGEGFLEARTVGGRDDGCDDLVVGEDAGGAADGHGLRCVEARPVELATEALRAGGAGGNVDAVSEAEGGVGGHFEPEAFKGRGGLAAQYFAAAVVADDGVKGPSGGKCFAEVEGVELDVVGV